ncbi:MAG: ATP-binding protein [Candidatus Neomarinimicrobiota bacterium]
MNELDHKLPVATVVVQGGIIKQIGPGIAILIGRPAMELTGSAFRELAVPDQSEVLERVLWECEHLTVSDHLEYRSVNFAGKADREVWLEFRGRRDTWQEQETVIGVVSEITDWKRRELELRTAQRSQQVLISNMPSLVYRCGPDHNRSLEFLSLETERLTGYNFEELMGPDPVCFEDLVIASDRDLVCDSVRAGIDLRRPFEIDYRITTKSGEVKYVHEIGRALHDERGAFLNLVGMIFDVSEKRRTDEKLLQSERMVAMGEMASGVAHDFNNVLTGILGRAQLLQFMDVPENLMKDLQTIEKIAHDGAEVVKRIQVFTRSRSAGDFAPVDINSIIRDVVDMMRPRWRNQALGRQVHIDMLTELGPVPRIRGNEVELREVLTNLINNAIDSIREKGSIRIRSELIEDQVVIGVRDSGVGIPSALHRKIFAPFFSTKGANGIGLGLSVAKNIVQRHEGEISVESEPGEGALFQLSFPVARILADAPAEKKTETAITPARIMIVEEVDNVRNLMKDILEMDGHEVHCFDSGAAALDELPGIQPEIIISDVNLATVVDNEFTERIRVQHPGVHIILSSGLDDHVYQEKTRGSQVELMIRKPFNIKQLRAVLNQARQTT